MHFNTNDINACISAVSTRQVLMLFIAHIWGFPNWYVSSQPPELTHVLRIKNSVFSAFASTVLWVYDVNTFAVTKLFFYAMCYVYA